MGTLSRSREAVGRELADQLDLVALRARALTTVLEKEVKDEVQDGLIHILDDLVTDLEELLPAARALARRPSPAAEPAA